MNTEEEDVRERGEKKEEEKKEVMCIISVIDKGHYTIHNSFNANCIHIYCQSWFVFKLRMILRCVKKAISYKCSYVITIVVPYQIHTVVIMTICANQENNID